MNPSPALFIPLPVNIFPNKLATNVLNKILRNPSFCYFASFWIVSLTPLNNKPESSRDLTILIMSSTLSFDIISVVVPEAAVAVNENGIKALLANGLITFSIKGNPVFSNLPRSLPRNPPGCIILDNWVFDKIISIDKLFAKALQRFATYLLVNNNLCGN